MFTTICKYSELPPSTAITLVSNKIVEIVGNTLSAEITYDQEENAIVTRTGWPDRALAERYLSWLQETYAPLTMEIVEA